MSKSRKERYPKCGSIDVIKWGRQCCHQPYKCNSCNSLFTFSRKDVSCSNRFVWFEWWILRKQTVSQISALSGHSERQLYRWFDQYLEGYPEWEIQRREKVNLQSAGVIIESVTSDGGKNIIKDRKDMFHFIDNPRIPKTTNALESSSGI